MNNNIDPITQLSICKNLFGISIIETNYLVKEIQIAVNKTWKERLLSWPWKPWIKTKIKIEYVPDEETVYHDKINNIIYCHPIVAQRIKKQCGTKEES